MYLAPSLKNASCNNSQDAGFTFMEILVAMVLFGIVATSALAVLNSSARWMPKQFDESMLYLQAQSKIELFTQAVRQDWWLDSSKPLGDGTGKDIYASDTLPKLGVIVSNTTKVSRVEGRDYRKVEVSAVWTPSA